MNSRWIHIGVWLAGYCFLNLTNGTVGAFTAGTEGYWLVSLYGLLFNVAIFYFHIDFLFPKFLNRRQWYLYILFLISVLLGLTVLETYIDFLFIQRYPTAYVNTFPELLEENILTHLVLVLFPSYLYRLTSDWFKNERQKQRLKEEKLSAELSFLKAQINPHFLFNTLNNLFAMAHQNNDPSTATGIAKLARMMRYMLEESEVAWVSLEQEIENLKNYMDLQSMRFAADDPVEIDIVQQGEFNGKLIAPLLLIPFVENAFKHGINLREKSFISIEINIVEDQFRFQVKNSLHLKKLEKESHGIGLENVRTRLALLYPNEHHLTIDSNNQVFNIELWIQLKTNKQKRRTTYYFRSVNALL